MFDDHHWRKHTLDWRDDEHRVRRHPDRDGRAVSLRHRSLQKRHPRRPHRVSVSGRRVEVVRNGVSSKVTQIAFPESANAVVYGSGVYASRGQNPTANTRDMVFADSVNSELAVVSGDPASRMSVTFQVGIAA
jgi:hypothetical protein